MVVVVVVTFCGMRVSLDGAKVRYSGGRDKVLSIDAAEVQRETKNVVYEMIQ